MKRERREAARLLLAATLVVWLAGCGRKDEEPSAQAVPPQPVQQQEQMSPEDLRYAQAAESFVHAIANQQYAEAYELLSDYAKSRMTLNQFVAPTDVLTLKRNEQTPFLHVTAANFVELMKKVQELYGLPQSVVSLTVFSTNTDILCRRNLEGAAIIESASAIGTMPDAIPFEIRRASVHAQIATALTPGQLRQAAAEMDVKLEDLQKDTNFMPSFNLKVVLIEQQRELKVGYFEFLPSTRWN